MSHFKTISVSNLVALYSDLGSYFSNFLNVLQFFKWLLPFINFVEGYNHVIFGRDEKSCKMDVHGLEKCSLVDIDEDKCNINVNRWWSTLTTLLFSWSKSTSRKGQWSTLTSRKGQDGLPSTSTTAFFSGDGRQPFSSRPDFLIELENFWNILANNNVP